LGQFLARLDAVGFDPQQHWYAFFTAGCAGLPQAMPQFRLAFVDFDSKVIRHS
jgi:hypothetical protein